MIELLFLCPLRKRKRVETAGYILAANVVSDAPPYKNIEGEDPFLSLIVNNYKYAARHLNRYQGCILDQGGRGLTASQ